MGLLPENFQFTQSNLQDFVDCRRRFKLRYLDQLRWPAVESEPFLENEKHLRMGAVFHRLVQQHLSGIPAERLTAMLKASRLAGSDLEIWWTNYLDRVAALTPPEYQAGSSVETVLSAPIGGYRLLAKIDAIFWSETGFQQKALIVDWKTSRQRPRRQWLAERLQTRIYPYVLTQTGAQGIMLEPEDITMVYWFPLWPEQPERFAYSRQQLEQDKAYLERLIKEIASLDESAFHLTPNEERCSFCTYRSLCERGIKAGSLEQDFEDQQEDRDFFFDIDQIAEVEF